MAVSSPAGWISAHICGIWWETGNPGIPHFLVTKVTFRRYLRFCVSRCSFGRKQPHLTFSPFWRLFRLWGLVSAGEAGFPVLELGSQDSAPVGSFFDRSGGWRRGFAEGSRGSRKPQIGGFEDQKVTFRPIFHPNLGF